METEVGVREGDVPLIARVISQSVKPPREESSFNSTKLSRTSGVYFSACEGSSAGRDGSSSSSMRWALDERILRHSAFVGFEFGRGSSS